MVAALVVVAVVAQRLKPEECDQVAMVVARRKRMNATRGQPGRGIRLHMLRRAVRLLEAGNTSMATPQCPAEPPPRGYCESCHGRTPTLLWTFPGSGNTYVRTLIESATAVYTGSIFEDPKIARLMPGETALLKTEEECARVSVIKAHPTHQVKENLVCGFPIFYVCGLRVARAVMVTRHPFSASWAEYQRKVFHKHRGDEHKQRLTDLPTEEWLGDWATDGPQLVRLWAAIWRPHGQYTTWMMAYGDDSFLITRFEDLVDPASRNVELANIIDFIGLADHATNTSIACAFNSQLAEAFHRPPQRRRRRRVSTYQPFADEDAVAEPADTESDGAREAWEALNASVRRDAWRTANPYAEALGYTTYEG